MESSTQEKGYRHYHHTDRCKNSRWTARECYQFMSSRDWQKVNDFYSDLVKGSTTLSCLLGVETPVSCNELETSEASDEIRVTDGYDNGRWKRTTFKIVLSYHGGSFDGWQKQPGLNTVQGLMERSLGSFVDEKKAQRLKDRCLPLEGCVLVAGRTDKGVTAVQQVCSFYTWRTDIKSSDVEYAVNSIAPGKLRVISVSKVPRAFHPNFSAIWRHYLYILPLNNAENSIQQRENIKIPHVEVDGYELPNSTKPQGFHIEKVNTLLYHLEGRRLSYRMFARDTKASRNNGPHVECFVYHARAAAGKLPNKGQQVDVMCVELVANRFLRKMVRVLVATSIREAAAGAVDDSLLTLMDATCRRATAPPAPPHGLCLVDVGYSNFDPTRCLIK